MHEMKPKRIPVSGPSITEKEVSYVTDAVQNAWYENANMYHQRFERAAADYIGVKYAIALPSCTSAIHLALAAANVGPGDEVIVPDITWIASVAPTSYVGATPVFADIDASSWCLSPESFEACITPRTKAVVPVDLYGNVADMDRICEIAKRHGIFVIEDAAEAIGGLYKGRKAGSLGDVGVFSFHGSKIAVTGEGGMLVTDNREIYDRVLVLRDHGRRPGDRFFWNTEVAYKYKMSSMQAALGLAQVERLEELVARRREIFSWYQKHLGGDPRLTLNAEAPDTRSIYWMITVVWDASLNLEKQELMERLDACGIDTRPFFHPISSLPAFADSVAAREASARNRVAYDIGRRGLNLPSGFNLTPDMVAYVCKSLQEVLDTRTAAPVLQAAITT